MLYPADNSNVWVAEIDGQQKLGILKCSDLVKCLVTIGGTTFTLTDGQIQMNDGSKGGLTITPELKTQLDKTNSLLTNLIGVINGAPIPEPGSGANSAFQTALKTAIAANTLGDYSNIENTNIKQG